MEKYLNTSLSADCSSRVYDCGRGLRGLACRQILHRRPLTSPEVLCWRLQTPDTRVRGVPPSRTALPPAPGGGKRTRGAYTEGILLWVFPGCCSNVFLWADLTQPGGEVHWSKPVRAKSKPARHRHLEGETDASGLHGWGLAVALAQMLLQSVPMG